MEIFKVIITDDHKIFRTGLTVLLNSLNFIKVVAEVSNGIELLECNQLNEVDIIFMDINMPEMNGIEATRKVLEKYPKSKIIALTMFSDAEYFHQMLDAGAVGFLLKNSEREEIEKAIRMVVADENYFSEQLIIDLMQNKTILLANEKIKFNSSIKVTKREQEILKLICKGLSNQEIADKLFISQRTVQGHRANLISKTDSKNSIDLVVFAIRNKLVEI